jgi:hypothetical protein
VDAATQIEILAVALTGLLEGLYGRERAAAYLDALFGDDDPDRLTTTILAG